MCSQSKNSCAKDLGNWSNRFAFVVLRHFHFPALTVFYIGPCKISRCLALVGLGYCNRDWKNLDLMFEVG